MCLRFVLTVGAQDVTTAYVNRRNANSSRHNPEEMPHKKSLLMEDAAPDQRGVAAQVVAG